MQEQIALMEQFSFWHRMIPVFLTDDYH